MTRIALLRHYPTAWNAAARLQGRSDVPLTDAARAVLATLRMPPPWDAARIVASPLIRAAETAHLLAEGRPVAYDERLVELSFGEWEGRYARVLMADPTTGFRPTHEWTGDTRAPGGESIDEAWARICPALAEIATDPTPAVIVLHKAMMRIVLRRAWARRDIPEIKRGRLYPLTVDAAGEPADPGEPARLAAREPAA